MKTQGSKFSLSRHFEYANEQITYHFWLCISALFLAFQRGPTKYFLQKNS
jgi:hypothetical protein